ncbi:protein KIAA0100 [Trichonephila inaurata madagascariensis]|uniref:Protein KIAA0100 n=1 Tax=Trichonephila inaurata madagascariensis TaxID=2747483 RepID=A0A8X6YM99_9ARAC|nr:protein KIAA0100 [Trichonephila inaurata madagascariensis]
MLRGCVTAGYIIVSAAKAIILQRVHSPVWKDRSLASKTTWIGSFECMQYYCTVGASIPSPTVDDVVWLSVLVLSNPKAAPTQLQRIVSLCDCQIFYASYGENMDPSILEEVLNLT